MPWWEKSLSGCDKVQCNILGISILYNGKIEGFVCGFPCFLPDYDAIFHAQKIAKRIVLFSCFTQFWARNEADEPHFSALYTPKLHLCTLVLMPGAPVSSYPKTPFGMSHFTFWGIPFHHLGCPILPFGVSHFTIWGIFSAHLRTMYSHDARFPIFVFSLQKFVRFLSFRFIMFLRNSFGWIKYIL
jgi:hypothetical protein